MVKWNEQQLKELVRKMGLKRASGQEEAPVHLSLYVVPHITSVHHELLLAQIMRLDADQWAAMGYTETDRVLATRYLGSLGCPAEEALSNAACSQQPLTLELAKALLDAGAFSEHALSMAAQYQHPLPFELAKLLVDAGARDKKALSYAACFQRSLTLELARLLIDAEAFDKEALLCAARWQRPLTLDLAKFLINAGAFNEYALRATAVYQQPLTFELAKLLIDAGCDPAARDDDGWDSLVFLVHSDHPVDPQVTDLFLSAGCRTDLDARKYIAKKLLPRFDQILKEHAEWKEKRDRMVAENSPADLPRDLDWSMTFEEAYHVTAKRWFDALRTDVRWPDDMHEAVMACMPSPMPVEEYKAWTYPWTHTLLKAGCESEEALNAEIARIQAQPDVAHNQTHALDWMRMAYTSSALYALSSDKRATPAALGRLWIQAMCKDRDRFLRVFSTRLRQAAVREMVDDERGA